MPREAATEVIGDELATALRPQPRQRELDRGDGAGEVGVDGLAHLLELATADRQRVADARVGDHDVEAAELARRPLEGRVDRREVGDVERQRQHRGRAEAAQTRRQGLESLGTPAGDRDGVAAPRELHARAPRRCRTTRP